MMNRTGLPQGGNLYDVVRSWTDALPICKDSGIGLSMNSVYREDGNFEQEHEYEDQSFHFKCDDKISIYGVFDGHDGVQLAKQALDTITAEVLFGQLEGKTSDEDVKYILKQAFSAVEQNYEQVIGDKLAEKASLQMEIPDNINMYEAYQKYPNVVNKLNAINTELSCGTTVVLALIYLNRLFVANVGDSRALLCKTDEDGVLRVLQLSQDHVLSNEDEILRLIMLGISKEQILKGFRIGNHEHTRCLGHYLVKGGYKEFEELACASTEPVIAEPEIAGGISLDGSYKFLILMSSGLYRSLEEATGTQCVNKEIIQLVAEQFKYQSTLTGVAQAVVDKVVRIHHDFYMSRSGSDKLSINKREDITLLIRNFNFPMPNAISPTRSPNITFSSITRMNDLNEKYALGVSVNKMNDTKKESTFGTSDGSTRDSTQTDSISISRSPEKVKPYVNFNEYYILVEKAKRERILPDIEF